MFVWEMCTLYLQIFQSHSQLLVSWSRTQLVHVGIQYLKTCQRPEMKQWHQNDLAIDGTMVLYLVVFFVKDAFLVKTDWNFTFTSFSKNLALPPGELTWKLHKIRNFMDNRDVTTSSIAFNFKCSSTTVQLCKWVGQFCRSRSTKLFYLDLFSPSLWENVHIYVNGWFSCKIYQFKIIRLQKNIYYKHKPPAKVWQEKNKKKLQQFSLSFYDFYVNW